MDCPESGAVNADATLWCWGNDEYGQLGTGDPAGSEVAEPTQVGTNDWSAISMGLGSACGIRSDPVARALENTLWCRGETPGGDELTPTQVGTATDCASVSTFSGYASGIRTDGTLWCWTNTGSGGTLTPTQVGTATDWSTVSVDNDDTCATRTDDTLWCWGDNPYGQLGTGNTDDATETAPGSSRREAGMVRRFGELLSHVRGHHRWDPIVLVGFQNGA